jgi:hypothetical protein
MKNLLRTLLLVSLLACFAVTAQANFTVINFDNPGLLNMGADNQPIGVFYLANGVTFSGANGVWAGLSLDPTFPPLSPPGVAYDAASIMQIDFSVPVNRVSYYFTTNDNLSMAVFDTNGHLQNLFVDFFVGCNFLSDFCSAPPNMLDSLSTNYFIGSIWLYSDDGPNSFTIDNLGFGTPEPASLLLFGSGALAIASRLRSRR